MNTMRTCPKDQTIILLMPPYPVSGKSEWVTAKWSFLYDCWVSTWGLCFLFDPIGWYPLPQIESQQEDAA